MITRRIVFVAKQRKTNGVSAPLPSPIRVRFRVTFRRRFPGFSKDELIPFSERRLGQGADFALIQVDREKPGASGAAIRGYFRGWMVYGAGIELA